MDELDTPGKRLRFRRLQAGIPTAAELARAIGKPSVNVNQHEADARGITPAMARLYGYKLKRWPESAQSVASWLLLGDQFNQVSENATPLTNAGIEPNRVPILHCTDMEHFRSIVAGAIPMSNEEVFAPKDLGAGKRTFIVKMIDQSMESAERNSINKDEHVFIDPDAKYDTDNIVAALAEGFSTLIIRKYIVTSIDHDGMPLFNLTALNPNFPSVPRAHLRDTLIIGKVIGALRIFGV